MLKSSISDGVACMYCIPFCISYSNFLSSLYKESIRQRALLLKCECCIICISIGDVKRKLSKVMLGGRSRPMGRRRDVVINKVYYNFSLVYNFIKFVWKRCVL